MPNVQHKSTELLTQATNAFLDGDLPLATQAAEQFKVAIASLPVSERAVVQENIWRVCDEVPEEKQMELLKLLTGSYVGDPPEPIRKPGSKSAKILAEFLDLGYHFRQDRTDDSIEVNGEPLTDTLRATIRMEMRDRNWRGMAAIEDVMVAEAYRNAYHPVREYLESLTYNGAQNIEELARHLIDEHGAAADWLKAWLVGAIAKVYGKAQNPMLVLSGPQNIGKSFFARWLCSPLPDRFVEGNIEPDNKDHQLQLIRKWIWEVGELGNTMRRADREALKFLLTQEVVTVRKPYGRNDIVKPALASFIGTINNEYGFLNDSTGNRRFLILDLKSIMWSYSKKVDVNQVWAEAFRQFSHGDLGKLRKEQVALAQNINAQFEIEDPIEDILRQFYEIDPAQETWFTPTSHLLDTLENNGLHGSSRRGHQMQLAAILKKWRLARSRRLDGDQLRGYVGIRSKNLF